MKGGVEWQVHPEAKPSVVFAIRPHPECYIFMIFIIQHVSIRCFYWVFVGGLLGPLLAHSADSVSCHDLML